MLEVDAATRTQTPCGFSLNIEGLYALSNHRLKGLGIGSASPLVVLEDGVPLATFATRRDYEERCAGAATVGRNVVLFSPSTETPEAAAAHTYTLALSSALPQETPEGVRWWAYPETRLSARFADDADWAGHTLTLQVQARTPQNRMDIAPILRVGDQEVALSTGADNHLHASLMFSVPDGAWEATLVVPAGAPYLIVDSWELTSSSGEHRSLLETTQVTLQALAVTPDVSVGIDMLAEQIAQVEGKPPALDLPTDGMTTVSATVARLEQVPLADLASRRLRDRLGIRYSPVEVLEDGKPLPEPNASCKKVKEQARGRYCHSESVILISASDGSDPLLGSHRYQLRLSESRRFDGGLWLYPDDQLRSRTLAIPAGTAKVELWMEGAAVSEGAQLYVRLHNAETVLAEQRFDAAQLDRGPLLLELSNPPPGLQLTATAEGGHLVLTSAQLRTP